MGNEITEENQLDQKSKSAVMLSEAESVLI